MPAAAYGNMKIGQLRQRIKDGDEDASAYLADRLAPLQESLKRALEPMDNLKLNRAFKLPAFEPIEFPDLTATQRELDRAVEAKNRRLAAEKRAAVEREQTMLESLDRMRLLAEDSALREQDAEEHQRKMMRLTLASSAASVCALIVAVVAIVAG